MKAALPIVTVAVAVIGAQSGAAGADGLLRLGAFADTTLGVSDGATTFALGQTDLFLTSQPSDNLRALAETVLEFDGNDLVVDLERIHATWDFSDALSVTVGRYHQALGYYNQAYHHGSYLMTTVDRPLVVAFEDESGVLPIHNIGVELSGTPAVGPIVLGYDLDVGNGRGRFADEITNLVDHNRSKSVGLRLYVEHPGLGLRVGGNVLWDRIPRYADDVGATVHPSLGELLLGGHAVLAHEGVLAIAEGWVIRHTGEDVETANTLGGYVELSSDLRWPLDWHWMRPYLRLDLVDYVDRPEPFFSPTATQTDQGAGIAGLKIEPGSSLAIKLEYQRRGFPRGEKGNAAVFQAAFSF